MNANVLDIEQKSQTTKELIINEIINCFQNSTFHGLSKIVHSRFIILKILWVFIFITCFIFCIFGLLEHFENYYDYNVLTFVDTGYERPVTLPAVTICGILDPFQTVLKKCIIRPDEKSNPVLCDASYFSQINVPGYENSCFTYKNGFNLRGNETQITQSDGIRQRSGIIIELYVSNYVKGYDAFIHNQSLCALNEQNIKILRKTYTEVGLRRTNILRMKKPYSNCVDRNNFPGETFVYFKEVVNETLYSQKLCHTFCIKNYLAKNCSGSFSKETKLYNRTSCGTLSNIFKSCSEACVPECDSMIISSTVSTKNQKNIENLTIIDIYFEETSYMRINEVPAITTEQFLGNIG